MNWISSSYVATIITILTLFCIQSLVCHPPPPSISKDIVPMKSWLNKSCNLEVYIKLFQERMSGQTNETLISLLTSGTFESNSNINQSNYFGDYLDQLCLSIDENKVIDMHALDCSSEFSGPTVGADATCNCGFNLNSYDPNVMQPETERGGVKTYRVTRGLNRKLTLENGACVSGYRGHCNTSVPIPLSCASYLHCRVLQREGQLFQNKNNSDVYGFCDRTGPFEENTTFKISGTTGLMIYSTGGIGKLLEVLTTLSIHGIIFMFRHSP